MASGNEDEKNTGFTITDRRGVGDGDSADPAVAPPDSSPAAGAYPPVDFHTFILSLGSSALYHMGELDGRPAFAVEVDESAPDPFDYRRLCNRAGVSYCGTTRAGR